VVWFYGSRLHVLGFETGTKCNKTKTDTPNKNEVFQNTFFFKKKFNQVGG